MTILDGLSHLRHLASPMSYLAKLRSRYERLCYPLVYVLYIRCIKSSSNGGLFPHSFPDCFGQHSFVALLLFTHPI